MIYQILGPIFGIIAIIVAILRFKEGKMNLGMFSLWIFIWVMVIIISLFPELTGLLAIITGIQRGLDFIFIIGLIGCYYLIFRIYTMIENIEKEITELVREIAIQRENIKVNEENKESSKTDSPSK